MTPESVTNTDVARLVELIRDKLTLAVAQGKTPLWSIKTDILEWEEGGTVRRKLDGSLRITIDIPRDRFATEPQLVV